MKLPTVTVLALLLPPLLACVAFAEDAPDFEAQTLKGLDGVFIVVEAPTQYLLDAGLAGEAMRSTVESDLQKAGIRVLSRSEWLVHRGKPYVYLNVSAVPVRQGEKVLGCAYNIRLELNQSVTLDRDNSRCMSASTWSADTTGLASAKNVQSGIGDTIDDVVAKLGAAWAKVNPKSGAAVGKPAPVAGNRADKARVACVAQRPLGWPVSAVW